MFPRQCGQISTPCVHGVTIESTPAIGIFFNIGIWK